MFQACVLRLLLHRANHWKIHTNHSMSIRPAPGISQTPPGYKTIPIFSPLASSELLPWGHTDLYGITFSSWSGSPSATFFPGRTFAEETEETNKIPSEKEKEKETAFS